MNTWNFNTGLRRLRTSRNRISDKNEASMRHFGSGHVRNFLAKIANLRTKNLSIRTALRRVRHNPHRHRDKRKVRACRKRTCIRSCLGWRDIGCAGVKIELLRLNNFCWRQIVIADDDEFLLTLTPDVAYSGVRNTILGVICRYPLVSPCTFKSFGALGTSSTSVAKQIKIQIRLILRVWLLAMILGISIEHILHHHMTSLNNSTHLVFAMTWRWRHFATKLQNMCWRSRIFADDTY